MDTDEKYMRRCFELAEKGLGFVAPNPVVGALIVQDNKIIGEGYHQKFGESHAEVNAVKDALRKNPAQNFHESTLYVSLEPCSHIGKTPACTSLILSHQFQRVVIACEDPFEQVHGKGIRILQESGINVRTKVLEQKAIYINRRFFCFHQKKRPFIILKYAQSKDHFISAKVLTEENRWISNSYSRKLVHKWRSEEQAVIVGTNTARIDNPALTLREWPGNQPLRIVLDRDLNLSKSLKLFDRSVSTLVINERKNELQENLEYIRFDFNKTLISQLCELLYKRSIQSIIIEGGRKLLQSFIDENLWDEARIFTGDKNLKSGVPAPDLNATLISSQAIDNDLLEIYSPLFQ